MSSTSDDESRARPPKVRPNHGDQSPSDSGGPSSGDNQLDIEPDALLDSLLADGDEFVEGPLDSEHDGSFPDEEEVTGVAIPAPIDEFSEVDDLLTKSTPPPKAPPVAVKSAKATLQGLRPAAPRPGVPRPQVREFSRTAPPPPERRSAEPPLRSTTRKPPPVNPAGPPPREPFLPAMSPKAPPARVKLLAEEPDLDDNSSEEEPTFRAYVTDADLEASRPSSYELADALEPDQVADSDAEYPPDFEDLDEDILESVPPDPPDSLEPDSFAPDSLPPVESNAPKRESLPADSLALASVPPDSLPPDSFPSDSMLAPSPDSFHAEARGVPPSSLPPTPSSRDGQRDSAPRQRFSSADGFGRASVDTLLEDEHTELVDSIPPDEALGTYRSERSAAEHLSERGLSDEWRARAEWFERQAHATLDPAAKARALLVASEHF
ncbi:MAG TPA: hypothetical protein VFU02_22785, partial [Polyangiaceae bacterium]|nr:hypothetical protein [Polyangiaceae bacterium]